MQKNELNIKLNKQTNQQHKIEYKDEGAMTKNFNRVVVLLALAAKIRGKAQMEGEKKKEKKKA